MKKRILSVIMGMMILGSFAAISASADDIDFSDAVQHANVSVPELNSTSLPEAGGTVEAENNGANLEGSSTDSSTVTTGDSTGIAFAAAVLGISGAAAAVALKKRKQD